MSDFTFPFSFEPISSLWNGLESEGTDLAGYWPRLPFQTSRGPAEPGRLHQGGRHSDQLWSSRQILSVVKSKVNLSREDSLL